MPVTYSLHGPLLRIELVGVYDPSDIIQAFLTALDDPAARPMPVDLLLNATRSDVLDWRSPAQIRSVAEFLGPHRERISGRCAVVAKSELHDRLSRAGSASSQSAGVETQVFRSEAEALTWLGVAPGPSPTDH